MARIVGILVAVAGVAAVVAVAAIFSWEKTRTDDGADISPNYPGSPKEFLYLDSPRVASYLAQVDGGEVESEKLTRKLTQSLNAKLTLDKAAEAGSASAAESFAERVVKPTAESSFFALVAALEDREKAHDELKQIHLEDFERGIENLNEGRFIRFATKAIRLPLYVNAYLAGRNASTVTAIFPGSSDRKKAAEAFMARIGETPRLVVTMRPTGSGGTERSAPFAYMLPMNAQMLTGERSLLKYGGGNFTIVGKIVRQFPRGSVRRRFAYVDSPTLETWEQPLLRAPGELLCRTNTWCATRVRMGYLRGRRRLAVIAKARQMIIEALREETLIRRRGTVILPVAIYK
ncbi:MAG TPA: hypothetical protein VFY04_01415 [Solirubrobacterales bacterium]|nr:hypothetical protein [Solirubrobacterales bacterium]